MITREKLTDYIDQLLDTYSFNDYCPNGLQVQGGDNIHSICFAVSATYESINYCVSKNCNAMIVHHGIMWNYGNSAKPIVGPYKKRVAPLIKNDINLLAYHLPLDANMEVGNAAEIARILKMQNISPFGEYKNMPLGVKGEIKSCSPLKLKEKLEKVLNHNVIVATPNENAIISSLGIITGGANNEWTFCLKDRIDAYLTGEISEYNWHESKEAGVHMFAGGHNATEEFGIKALMKSIQSKFDVECFFISSDNPA